MYYFNSIMYHLLEWYLKLGTSEQHQKVQGKQSQFLSFTQFLLAAPILVHELVEGLNSCFVFVPVSILPRVTSVNRDWVGIPVSHSLVLPILNFTILNFQSYTFFSASHSFPH